MYIYVDKYIYLYIYIYVCICLFIYIYTFMYFYTYIYRYVYMYVFVYIYYFYIYIYLNMYIYIHIMKWHLQHLQNTTYTDLKWFEIGLPTRPGMAHCKKIKAAYSLGLLQHASTLGSFFGRFQRPVFGKYLNMNQSGEKWYWMRLLVFVFSVDGDSTVARSS